jgi:hypothetical protein
MDSSFFFSSARAGNQSVGWHKVFGQAQSFVPSPPTNIQFMVKDSKKYAATGGWAFAQFDNGKPLTDKAMLKSCFECHQAAKDRDFVFAHYAP